MIRTHVSRRPIELDNVIREQDTFKPRGLWYQIDNSWEDWCQSEMPDWIDKITNKYQLELDMTNVLVLSTIEEMTAFTHKYRHSYDGTISRFRWYINWDMVASDYKGIEIPFYLWPLRMHEDFHWYYSWDVASGCVFDPSIIKTFKEITIKAVVGSGSIDNKSHEK